MPLKGPLLALGLAVAASMATSTPDGDAPWRSRAGDAGWSEVKWPFLLDQWGIGKAFRCAAADCGQAMMIYLRPKIGFCNCATGVSDDAELDRVGDVDLIGQRFAPIGDGRPIAVAWMNGASRAPRWRSRSTTSATWWWRRWWESARCRRTPSASRSPSSTAGWCCAGSKHRSGCR